MLRWLAAATAALLVGCADPSPVVLSSRYAPPPLDPDAPLPNRLTAAPACSVRLADIADLRGDPASLGADDNRQVHAADATAWIRSGLLSLGRSGGIRFVDPPEPGALVLHVELIQAYVAMNLTSRDANVVIRVRYSRGAAPLGDQIYRGVDLHVEWSNRDAAVQAALNRALADLLDKVQADLVRRCLH